MKFLSSYQREMIKSQITLDKRVKLENEQIYYVIDSINRAISEKRQIEFDYYKYHIVDNKPKLEKSVASRLVHMHLFGPMINTTL